MPSTSPARARRSTLTSLLLCAAACNAVGGSSGAGTTGGPSGGGGASGSSGGGGHGGASSGGSSGGGNSGSSGSSSGGTTGAGSDAGALAALYPCDQGIGNDPAVVWSENFGEGSVAAFQKRYDNVNDPGGQTLVNDVPAGSCSTSSVRLVSSGDAGANATDFFKEIEPGRDEWYVRWYAKYQGGVLWHHSGVWFGGYNPPLAYPYPHAGDLPAGDDRFSVAIEPIFGVGSPNPQFDTYDYWMAMHSFKANPVPGDYFGNAVINQTAFVETDGSWICLEVHVKLNSDPTSAVGAAMDVWRDDVLVQHYDEQGPPGFWTADKFCPQGADDYPCVTYPPPAGTPLAPLDLQWRSTTALQLDYFWPQNYITDPGPGALQFADMVIATSRVGCLRPKP
ncbi:MAG: hypothetical protein ACYDCL_06685 [Myxococcales bacterium]